MSQRVAAPDRTPALVTGGGRGIGRAAAIALAEAGHDVALVSRSAAEVEAVAEELAALGVSALALPADLTDAHGIDDLVRQVTEALGPPLILVNNAGAAESHKFEGHPDELWERMLAINLTAAYRLTKACAPAMLAAGWGRVINIGSVASLTGNRYIAAYTAAKHGLLGLTRALAAEWAMRGVTVNLVAPGYVDTAMTVASVANIVRRTGRAEVEARSAITAMSPQHRLVRPEEVAAVVRLLASEAAASINGAVVPVDGGASAIAGTG
jgi:NAD(P)-dependent dehydrogenase (short-subunit alcohol dehydrogenase family)